MSSADSESKKPKRSYKLLASRVSSTRQPHETVQNTMSTRRKSAGPLPNRRDTTAKAAFTARQGQFLAYIHLYRKLHGEGPSEVDLVRFFRVSPPSVHGMIVRLEELRLVVREPGVPRSVRVAISPDAIPDLLGAG